MEKFHNKLLDLINYSTSNNDDSNINKHGVQLAPIKVDENYVKKWNIKNKDFICIVKNGELLNNYLYRVGGLGTNKIKGLKYFLLLKYVESYYNKDIINFTGSDPKHLESRWCIIDEYGSEKVEFEKFSSPSLIKNSCIYSIDNKYYNIETGYFYCKSYSHFETENYIFIENCFDDKDKRGVLKIDKGSGKFELFN